MTVARLIQILQRFPQEAQVFAYNSLKDDAFPVESVTQSEDAPEEEVYLEIG